MPFVKTRAYGWWTRRINVRPAAARRREILRREPVGKVPRRVRAFTHGARRGARRDGLRLREQ
jgi:hypothetical protein